MACICLPCMFLHVRLVLERLTTQGKYVSALLKNLLLRPRLGHCGWTLGTHHFDIVLGLQTNRNNVLSCKKSYSKVPKPTTICSQPPHSALPLVPLLPPRGFSSA